MRKFLMAAAVLGMATGLGAIPAAPVFATSTPTPAAAPALSLTPYDPAHYTDLYTNPNGPITGSTYIFNPTANQREQMAYDFAHMRDVGVNTVGFYNLVQMTDADRDALFTDLEANRQKAVVRIEWYDSSTFDFGTDDAASVLRYYNTDDSTHGYTALLNYLIRKNRLRDIAYFALNMPVDDGTVASHFVTAQYPDGRANPAWASSQPPYVDALVSGMRGIVGASTPQYVSVFYGWDQSYQTPSYANIAHPADGYFFNNYSYPIGAPPDENASTSVRLNQPRLQTAMDRLVSQYPTQPKVVEYGLHTVEYNHGVVPGQTAGVMATIAAKKLALAETTAYYANGSSNGRPFNVRGTLYFAQNLYKEEGNPPAVMDWTLDYPATATTEAEDRALTRTVRATAVPVSGASGGRAVLLALPGSTVEFYNLAASSSIQLRYRSMRATTLRLVVNGSAPYTVRVPAALKWSTVTINLDVPLQGAVRVGGTGLVLDWLHPLADYEAEYATGSGTSVRGAAVTLPAGRSSALAFDHVRGGSLLTIRYAAIRDTSVDVSGVGTVALPAGSTSVTVPVTVDSGATLRLRHGAGAPAVDIDAVRLDGHYEAEASGGLYNGVHGVANASASAGQVITDFDVVGASVVFTEVNAGARLTFRYAATVDASMTLIGLGPFQRLDFPATGGRLATASFAVPVPANATVIVQRNSDNAALGLYLDDLLVGA